MEDKILKITSLTHELKGVGECDGRSYSFRYANIEDEVVFFELGKGNRRRTIAKEIISHSDKSGIACEYFQECGGCSGQHVPYETQFQLKTNPLVLEYKNQYDIELECIPALDIYNYRNRMDFVVFPDNIIGLHKAESHQKIVDIKECKIQSEWSNSELTLLREYFRNYPELPMDRKSLKGWLKYITLRKSIFSNDSMLILTFSEDFLGSPLLDTIKSEILKVSTSANIVFCYNRKLSEVSAFGQHEIIRGNDYYKEYLLEKEFHIPFDSFFQTNPKSFQSILKFIQNHLGNCNKKRLVDVFCGTGFFSIVFGSHFGEIFGFDLIKSSVDKANQILKSIYSNKLIDFKQIDLVQLKDVENFNFINSDSICILDPPRNGIGIKLCELLVRSELDDFFYISCNPYTQLSDLKILSQKFKIESAMVTDLFPHTPHLELVLYLKKKEFYHR